MHTRALTPLRRPAIVVCAAGLLVAGVAGPVAAKAKAPKPSVAGLSVNAGRLAGGTVVTIKGTGFTHVKKVLFGATAAKGVKELSARKLTVKTPKHSAGLVSVLVVTAAGKSSAGKHATFRYVAAPTVTHVSPAGGTSDGGGTVTVTGHNFSHVTKVTFGATKGASVKVASASSLSVKAPKHALGAVDVRVTTAYGTSAKATSDHFTYVAAPKPLNFVNTDVQLPIGGNANLLNQLYDVSCGAVGSCVGLGAYSVDAGRFVSVLASGTWTNSTVPLVTDNLSGHISSLDDVACASATSCVAVGQYEDSSAEVQGVIATYNGTDWTAIKAPLPAGAAPALNSVTNLTSIRCPSPTSCTAVGQYISTSAGTQGVIDTLSGGTWTAAAATLPGDALATSGQRVTLTGVACPAVGSCAAIGTYTRTNGYRDVLAESLSGGTWTAADPATPNDSTADPGAVTDSIACSAAGACAAVGFSNPSHGIEIVLHSGAWKVALAPDSTNNSTQFTADVNDVGCLAGGSCFAAGQEGSDTNGAVLVPIGGSAFAAPVPGDGEVTGSQRNGLGAAGCTTSLCLAGGDYWTSAAAGSHPHPLLDQYDGTSWVAIAAPMTSAGVGGVIESISCASPAFCVAVGYSITGDNAALPLADIGTP